MEKNRIKKLSSNKKVFLIEQIKQPELENILKRAPIQVIVLQHQKLEPQILAANPLRIQLKIKRFPLYYSSL